MLVLNMAMPNEHEYLTVISNKRLNLQTIEPLYRCWKRFKRYWLQLRMVEIDMITSVVEIILRDNGGTDHV